MGTLLLNAAQGTNFGQPVAKNSWITAKENAGSYLKHELSYQQTDPDKDRVPGFLL
jgi:hypothetical protein